MSFLEKSEIEEIKNLNNHFIEDLKSDISNENISNRKDCYLIKKSWYTHLSEDIINKNCNTIKSKFRRYYFNNNTNKFFFFYYVILLNLSMTLKT